MCAKIDVIWRWSKKSPHSGGTIWSNLSHFLNKGDYFHHLQSPNFSMTRWPTCAKHVHERKFGKNIFYNAPLRYRPMFWSVSLEGTIDSKKFKKNIKPWKPSFVCARDHVCQNWGDLEVVEKMPAFRRDHLVNLSQFLKKGEFFHHLQITQIFLYMVNHMCKTCVCKKILKKIILQCPLEA